MSMSIVTDSRYHSLIGYLYITISALMISIIIYFIFKSADKIKKFLGVTGIKILLPGLS